MCGQAPTPCRERRSQLRAISGVRSASSAGTGWCRRRLPRPALCAPATCEHSCRGHQSRISDQQCVETGIGVAASLRPWPWATCMGMVATLRSSRSSSGVAVRRAPRSRGLTERILAPGQPRFRERETSPPASNSSARARSSRSRNQHQVARIGAPDHLIARSSEPIIAVRPVPRSAAVRVAGRGPCAGPPVLCAASTMRAEQAQQPEQFVARAAPAAIRQEPERGQRRRERRAEQDHGPRQVDPDEEHRDPRERAVELLVTRLRPRYAAKARFDASNSTAASTPPTPRGAPRRFAGE